MRQSLEINSMCSIFSSIFTLIAQGLAKSRRFPEPTNLGQHPRSKSNASQAAQHM
jgi:hypothetical protein